MQQCLIDGLPMAGIERLLHEPGLDMADFVPVTTDSVRGKPGGSGLTSSATGSTHIERSGADASSRSAVDQLARELMIAL
jgi:hypothetical protein